jgi:hypothetical protein
MPSGREMSTQETFSTMDICMCVCARACACVCVCVKWTEVEKIVQWLVLMTVINVWVLKQHGLS